MFRELDYYDNLGYLTDFRYREGLRQYWPEDGRLLIDQWEQITYEPEHLSTPDATPAQPSGTPKTVQKPVVIVAQPSKSPTADASCCHQANSDEAKGTETNLSSANHADPCHALRKKSDNNKFKNQGRTGRIAASKQ